MAIVWINPAFQKKDKKQTEEQLKSLEKNNPEKKRPLSKSRQFFENLIDKKKQFSICFADGTNTTGKMVWFDTASICIEQNGKNMIFETKNIAFYRCT